MTPHARCYCTSCTLHDFVVLRNMQRIVRVCIYIVRTCKVAMCIHVCAYGHRKLDHIVKSEALCRCMGKMCKQLLGMSCFLPQAARSSAPRTLMDQLKKVATERAHAVQLPSTSTSEE